MSTSQEDFFFSPHIVGPSKEERINYLQNEIQRWRTNPSTKQQVTPTVANAPLDQVAEYSAPSPEEVIARLEVALQRLMASEG